LDGFFLAGVVFSKTSPRRATFTHCTLRVLPAGGLRGEDTHLFLQEPENVHEQVREHIPREQKLERSGDSMEALLSALDAAGVLSRHGAKITDHSTSMRSFPS
jgi:hypothetical protein